MSSSWVAALTLDNFLQTCRPRSTSRERRGSVSLMAGLRAPKSRHTLVDVTVASSATRRSSPRWRKRPSSNAIARLAHRRGLWWCTSSPVSFFVTVWTSSWPVSQSPTVLEIPPHSGHPWRTIKISIRQESRLTLLLPSLRESDFRFRYTLWPCGCQRQHYRRNWSEQVDHSGVRREEQLIGWKWGLGAHVRSACCDVEFVLIMLKMTWVLWTMTTGWSVSEKWKYWIWVVEAA